MVSVSSIALAAAAVPAAMAQFFGAGGVAGSETVSSGSYYNSETSTNYAVPGIGYGGLGYGGLGYGAYGGLGYGAYGYPGFGYGAMGYGGMGYAGMGYGGYGYGYGLGRG
ncbi:hypothetical protein LPJ75_005402, partial [Coemansia sp. RSA 2598]